MIEQALLLKLSAQNLTESTSSQLRLEYQAYQRLFEAQSKYDQQYLKDQAVMLTDAIVSDARSVRFSLPEHVSCMPMIDCLGVEETIPPRARTHKVGGLISRFTRTNLLTMLAQQLEDLEKSTSQAIATAAGLMRYAVVMHMISDLIPQGKTVAYGSVEDDDIPNQPLSRLAATGTFFTDRNDINSSGMSTGDRELSSHSDNYSQGFFLPQWVAFGDKGNLLVANVEMATTYVNTLRQYLSVLNTAEQLAPYIVVDEAYQYKRYGIMGQLVNQGRALAQYQVSLICQAIKERSCSHRLDRGFSLSLPYFNDKTLAIEQYHFDVIPRGQVMFVSAFVVLAARTAGAKVAHDTGLNRTSRRSLLAGLCTLEKAFLR